MSGGADFEPQSREVAEAAPVEEAPELVTRASTMSTSITLSDEPEGDVLQISAAVPEAEAVEAAVIEAALATEDPVEEEAKPQVILFESLVEGAPSSADILPESDIAVILPEGVTQVAAESSNVPQVSGTLRQVAGSRVNMRSGPGTNFGVVTTLSRGADVEVFEVNANGWARLRNVGTGEEGWMAERLLTGG